MYAMRRYGGSSLEMPRVAVALLYHIAMLSARPVALIDKGGSV